MSQIMLTVTNPIQILLLVFKQFSKQTESAKAIACISNFAHWNNAVSSIDLLSNDVVGKVSALADT